MERILDNWLTIYTGEYTKESESPDNYHTYVGLSTLASAVRRNVWLDMGHFTLYPNLYVVLVAPPGLTRKSSAMKMGQKLLKHIPNVRLGPESVTKEQLIIEMAKSFHDGQSALALHAAEMSDLIEPSGARMIQFLTTVYECEFPEGWKHSTKTQGKDLIKNPCLNLIACTTPSWIAEGLPITTTDHGFTSRAIFIYEELPRFLRPIPIAPPESIVEALIYDLKHIATLKGGFTLGEGALDLWTKIYHDIHSAVHEDHRMAGYFARKDMQVLKLGMLLSLAERDDLVIEVKDFEAALAMLEVVEARMPRTFSGVGKYDYTSDIEHLYNFIRSVKEIKLSTLYEKFRYLGVPTVQELVNSLAAMGRIQTDRKQGVARITERQSDLGFD